MSKYDEKVANAFLDHQLDLYPEEVAFDLEEAKEFLEESCAAIADTQKDALDYLEEVGVDIHGLSKREILEMPELIPVGDGRYLILEI